MENNIPRIILVGHGACGKDYMRKIYQSRGFRYSKSHTTRPMREDEIQGKDYHFVSIEEFQKMIADDKMYEFNEFNGWFYGTSKEEFYKSNIIVTNPAGVNSLSEEDRKNSVVIFLDIDIDIRRERLKNRTMPGDTADRRIQSDIEDFKNFTNYDIRITNGDF